MKEVAIISILILLTTSSLAQYSVHGQVYDAQTSKPLPGATVFVSNTTKGTYTDAEGNFRIDGLNDIHYNLVVSFLGYEPGVFDIVPGSSMNYQIKLKPTTKVLSEVVVKAKKISRAQWKAYLQEFETHFVGVSDNARKCSLENKDVLDLDKENAVLKASSDNAIILQNDGLGYKVKIFLQRFEFNSAKGSVYFEGLMVFEPLSSERRRVQKEWAKNRLRAYYGSKMHFGRALYDQRLNEEGFYFFFKEASLSDTLVWVRARALFNHEVQIKTLNGYKDIIDSRLSKKDQPVLNYNVPLEVLYIHEQESYAYQSHRGLALKRRVQYSELKSKQPGFVLPDGRIYPVEATEASGYWSWELMSEALPLDYDPAEDLKLLGRKD